MNLSCSVPLQCKKKNNHLIKMANKLKLRNDLFSRFIVCTDGTYGMDCNKTCGHCANNATCNKTSGHCPASCEASFQPPLCNSRKN